MSNHHNPKIAKNLNMPRFYKDKVAAGKSPKSRIYIVEGEWEKG